MQQNSKCRVCGDRDKAINHIINERCKLAQKKYKTSHNWVGKVIHWEMCKEFKFDYANKWYMHNTNGSPNLGHKTRPYSNQQKKRTYKIVNFAVPAEHRIKLKKMEKDKYLDLVRELKKTIKHEGDDYTNRDWGFW